MSIDESNDPKLSNEPTLDSRPHDGAQMFASSAGGAQ
jgi:hypothetical protein